MTSFQLIQCLPTQGTLPIPESNDIDEKVQLYEEMIDNDFTDTKLLRLISKHGADLGFLIKMIPFPTLARFHATNGLFHNFLTPNLVDTLITKNDKDIYYAILNKLDYSPYVFKINNHLNHLYNFRDNIFKKRLSEFKQLVTQIDLDQFYLGTDLILYLASTYQKKIDTKGIVFTIYSKLNKIKLIRPDNIYFDVKIGTFYILENGIILMFREMKYTVNDILYSGCSAVYSDDNIIIKPRLYQQLDQKITFTYNTRDLTQMKHLDNRAKSLNIKYTYKITTKTKKCYDCKRGYNLEFTLDSYVNMCMKCAIKNYKKRSQNIDLSGMVAYVSGARHKIGFETVLMLLRAGAKVIASTRFPNAAWYNYKQELDFDSWKDRLEIIRCEFTQGNDVHSLIEYLKTVKLNILINNACQTVKPTELYLKKAYQFEAILSGDANFVTKMLEPANMRTDIIKIERHDKLIVKEPEWSNMDAINANITAAEIKLNTFKDIEDLTMLNDSTWFKTMEKVDKEELANVITVNQLVPTMLVSELKPFMESPKFIINVTAIEGQFQSTKVDGNHPHTNMCKAAINMMVRTMGTETEKNFYIYAVDPGFVSGVDPTQDNYPLKPIDGASRILDPIFQWKLNKPINSGVKLKDFKISPW